MEVFPVDCAVVAVKEELLPIRHRLAVAFDALLIVGIPSSKVEESRGPPCELQLEEPTQLQSRHPHSMVDVVEDIEANHHAVGVWSKPPGGDLIEVQHLQDERMKGKR